MPSNAQSTHSLTPTLVPVLLLVLGLLAPLPAVAKENTEPPPAQKGDKITWAKDVPTAFARAVETKRPVMICINSKRVDGGKIEPAAKGLREIIYLDPRVVTKSRKFVCVFLTSEGSSDDYGELRVRFGIDGLIVSPQHIFAMPNHASGYEPLFRKKHWPYGKEEAGVKALLDMMDKALVGYDQAAPAAPGGEVAPQGATPPPAQPDAEPAPDGADERAEWIRKTLAIVKSPLRSKRREALRLLMTSDQDGDCINPVIALIPEVKTDLPVVTDVVRALGRPELEAAAEPIATFLKHKDEALRANAAVSLEYIGSATSVKPLMARAKREKVENIANHMYRALGRCGAGDAKVRALLIKQVKGAKSNLAAFGPMAGLAYFEQDPKAARAIEKLLKQMGPPGGGRRGGWSGNMKRGMLAWALSEIADPKSEAFVEEEILVPLSRSDNRWIRMAVPYYEAVAKRCGGDESAKDGVEQGIRVTLEWSGGTKEIHDDARKERDISRFEPKAEWEVEGRDWGGGGGRGGGGRKR